MIVHSDFLYSYTFSWVGCCADLFASTATPEEQLGRHEILRAQNRLRTRPQDDIVFLEGGCRPLHPCFTSANIAFCFLCILLYVRFLLYFVSSLKRSQTALPLLFCVIVLVINGEFVFRVIRDGIKESFYFVGEIVVLVTESARCHDALLFEFGND